MRKISALLLLAILMGALGCDNEDRPKPSKEPPAPPTIPKPQVN